MDQGENPSSPPLCSAGCGFFGNPACENMCSKCYRDLKKTAPSSTPSSAAAASPAARAAAPAPVAVPAPPPAAAAAALAAAAGACGEGAGSSDSPKKPKAPRCYTCRAKVGLLGFKCRCEQEFCPKHRHADEHNCPFDYKTFDRDNLIKANPVIQGEKLNKI